VGNKKANDELEQLDLEELDFSDIEEAIKEEENQEKAVEEEKEKPTKQRGKAKRKQQPKKRTKEKAAAKTNVLSEKHAITILNIANVTAKSFIKGNITEDELATIYQNAFNAAKAISI